MLWIPVASSAALVSCAPCAPCARPLLPSEGAARRRVQVVTPTGQIPRLYASAVAVRTPGGCCAAGDWRGVVRTAQMFVEAWPKGDDRVLTIDSGSHSFSDDAAREWLFERLLAALG